MNDSNKFSRDENGNGQKEIQSPSPPSSSMNSDNGISSQQKDAVEKEDEEEDNMESLSPMQKIHVFMWNIVNIIRNLNILKQYILHVKFQKATSVTNETSLQSLESFNNPRTYNKTQKDQQGIHLSLTDHQT